MLAEMTWEQFLEWRVYDSIEPFGEDRADLRSGTIASVIANVHAGKRKRFRPADFMPNFGTSGRSAGGEARQPLTDPESWRGVLKMAKIVAGAKDENGDV